MKRSLLLVLMLYGTTASISSVSAWTCISGHPDPQYSCDRNVSKVKESGINSGIVLSDDENKTVTTNKTEINTYVRNKPDSQTTSKKENKLKEKEQTCKSNVVGKKTILRINKSELKNENNEYASLRKNQGLYCNLGIENIGKLQCKGNICTATIQCKSGEFECSKVSKQ